jgi:hypothetical protein
MRPALLLAAALPLARVGEFHYDAELSDCFDPS